MNSIFSFVLIVIAIFFIEWKLKVNHTIFFIIVVIELLIAFSFFSKDFNSSDAAGNGMAKGFTLLYIGLAQIILFIVWIINIIVQTSSMKKKKNQNSKE